MAKKELGSLEVSAFCESLAMLLAAGTPADEAVGLLGEGETAGPVQAAAQAVQQRLLAGEGLAGAVQASGAFPAYAARMVAAGEAAGRTEQVLEGLARHYDNQYRLRQKLRSAVVYPVILLGLTAAILAVLVAKVLPVFNGVYQSFAGEVSASAYAYLRLAYGVGWAALALTLLLAALVALTALAARGGRGRAVLAAAFERCPLTARAARQLAVARFTTGLYIFTASGLDADTALAGAAGMTGHKGLSDGIRACAARMEQGEGLAGAVGAEKLFEPLYARMLLGGARAGSLEKTLGRLAELFSRDADEQVDRLIDCIEPALAGFLTVAVGVTLLAAMLPLIGILGGNG